MQAKDAGEGCRHRSPRASTGPSPGTARRRAATPLPAPRGRRAPACFAHRPPPANTGAPRSVGPAPAQGCPRHPPGQNPRRREKPRPPKADPALPGRSAPHTALPTRNPSPPPPPPNQTGITAQTGCGQSSLPTATGSRGAPWGAGRAPGGQRTARGAGEHPCARAGLRLETRHNSSHGFGGTPNPARREVPSGATPVLPRHRRRFLSPAHGRVHRRSDKRHRRASKRLRKEMEKARRNRQVESQEGLRPPPPQYGVRRDTPPRRGTRLRCRHRGCLVGDSPLGETEARRQAWSGGGTPAWHAAVCELPPILLGRETLPPNTHAVAGMTPAPRPPPAPPCSCRNPGAGAAGRRPAPPSCLRLPPLPAPRAPRGEGGGEHSRLGSVSSVSPSPQPWDATG